MFQAERQAKRASDDKRRERDEQRQANEAKAAEAAAFEALKIARHLEAYAKACAEVVAEPVSYSGGHAAVSYTPVLEPYDNVAWERLGAVATAQAMDLIERHRLRRGYISGDAAVIVESTEERGAVHANGSARLGLDAWETAVLMRNRAGLPPFKFVLDGWNFVATLKDRVELADQIAASQARSRL